MDDHIFNIFEVRRVAQRIDQDRQEIMSRELRLIFELYETVLVVSAYLSVSTRVCYGEKVSGTAAELIGDDSGDRSDIFQYTIKAVRSSSEEDQQRHAIRQKKLTKQSSRKLGYGTAQQIELCLGSLLHSVTLFAAKPKSSAIGGESSSYERNGNESNEILPTMPKIALTYMKKR